MSANPIKLVNDQLVDTAHTKNNYMVFMVMLSMAIVLCKGVFSYRIVEIHGYVLQAGQLIAPLWFLVSDMIAELYGYSVAKQTIIAGFVCQILFTLAVMFLINLPYPEASHTAFEAYRFVFGDLWRVDVAVLTAFLLAGFINIRLITKWKKLLNSKYFWLRSIGASGVSELIFSFIATFLIQYGKQEFTIILQMVCVSFLLKIIYSLVLAGPANVIVFLLKNKEQNYAG